MLNTLRKENFGMEGICWSWYSKLRTASWLHIIGYKFVLSVNNKTGRNMALFQASNSSALASLTP